MVVLARPGGRVVRRTPRRTVSTGFGGGARFALRVHAVERPSFRPAFTVKTASYNKSLLVSRTSALGERHIEKSTFLMLVRQRSAKKRRMRAPSQVECAAPRRRPGLPRTPRSFLSAGPSPPRFWGLAAPRGATRGNRLNSSRLASVSNRTLDCLASKLGTLMQPFEYRSVGYCFKEMNGTLTGGRKK